MLGSCKVNIPMQTGIGVRSRQFLADLWSFKIPNG